jgi:hypothetical protein
MGVEGKRESEYECGGDQGLEAMEETRPHIPRFNSVVSGDAGLTLSLDTSTYIDAVLAAFSTHSDALCHIDSATSLATAIV